METILIGTHNKAKKAFIGNFLDKQGISYISLADMGITIDVEETGTTYEENAALKAETYARLSNTPTIADDSGLEINALNNAPGIYSSRFAGENKTDLEKVTYILALLKNIPKEKRMARFVSVIAFAHPHQKTTFFKGISEGSIAETMQGSMHPHFPYYSIYIPEGYTQTVSELVDAGILFASHRTKALEQCVSFLKTNR